MIWKTREAPPELQARPTLFLDRDGVVIHERDYLAEPGQVELVPGAAAAMVRARDAGWQIIGLSNQSGLGRGRFGPDDFAAVMTKLESDLAASGAAYDGFYYCPHAPGEGCSCRKPATGLLDEAGAAFAWDPARSWVVGDKASDVALGQLAGLGSVLVRTGYGPEQERQVQRQWPAAERVLVVADLSLAVDLVLARDAVRSDS